MRHLVIGASSQVGEQLIKHININNEEVIGTFCNRSLIDNSGFRNKNSQGKLFKLDITDKIHVERIIQETEADVIYIPAANTNVDYCETNKEETNKTNIFGIINVVNAINDIKYKNKSKKEPLVIFYSTDYVFDGLQGLYTEKSITNPLNVYGNQKLKSEDYLINNSKHFIIIRTTGVFGPESQGKNFASRLINNLRDGKIATISDDEYGTPTYAPDLASATLKLVNNIGFGLRNDNYNIVNIAGRNYISRYQFALDIAKIFNCNTDLILPIKSNSLKRPANRPLLGGLNTELIENLIGIKVLSHIDGLIDLKKYL